VFEVTVAKYEELEFGFILRDDLELLNLTVGDSQEDDDDEELDAINGLLISLEDELLFKSILI
jgi:hypothetical protein